MNSASQLGPSAAQITMMGHNISAAIATETRRKRRRIRLGLLGTGVATALALTAAGIAVATAPDAMRAGTFACYTADDLAADVRSIGLTEDSLDPSIPRTDLAVAACAIEYARVDIPLVDPAVCELPDGRLAVFPDVADRDDGLCAALGLRASGD